MDELIERKEDIQKDADQMTLRNGQYVRSRSVVE